MVFLEAPPSKGARETLQQVAVMVLSAPRGQTLSETGMCLPIGHMLTPHTGKANIMTPQRVQPDSSFPTGIILARIWVEFSMIELPNPLKPVQHCKLTKRQTIRVSYAT